MSCRIIKALCSTCAIFLIACSSSPAVIKQEGRPDAMIRIDARPGEVQLLKGSLDAEPGKVPGSIRFEFELQKLQPSERWRPTLNICVYAGNEDQVICLQVLKTSGLSQLIPQVLIKEDGTKGATKKETGFLLEAMSTHTLDVSFSDSLVSFRIDGRLVHEQNISIVPSDYYFSCSSVVCSINIYQPPDRP